MTGRGQGRVERGQGPLHVNEEVGAGLPGTMAALACRMVGRRAHDRPRPRRAPHRLRPDLRRPGPSRLPDQDGRPGPRRGPASSANARSASTASAPPRPPSSQRTSSTCAPLSRQRLSPHRHRDRPPHPTYRRDSGIRAREAARTSSPLRRATVEPSVDDQGPLAGVLPRRGRVPRPPIRATRRSSRSPRTGAGPAGHGRRSALP